LPEEAIIVYKVWWACTKMWTCSAQYKFSCCCWVSSMWPSVWKEILNWSPGQ